MKKILIVATFYLPVAVSAASIAEYQNKCEQQFNKFPEMVSCLTSNIKSDSFYATDPDAKLYAAQANSLAGKVKRKSMYEEDAVLELQQDYTDMNNRYQAKQSAEPKDNSFISIIKDRLHNGNAPRQNQTTIINTQ
ncbi:Uncharacterised protein [Buttiauxella agrestis]|uniref:Uncharacterized protein n=1 Tax=Buttiauxella agrestis TaxID=82977 RepID=A0A381C8D0_9ENTR|nr:hypothetical protein [Buttiauxella agrestis]SUW64155.1 Uncharacterised protein [Buttiauxella agrestis]